MTGPPDLSIGAAGRALRSGELTAVALTRQALARIAARDPALHAFIAVTADRALAEAARADAALAAGTDLGPMHGIPYALKDIYDVAGLRTTCHSYLKLQTVATEDSTVAARLAAGGAVLLGKTATHEFAIGGPSHDLPFPAARNPWNPEHIPGGSSSGSAAAVAAGMLRVALGSDTGGSIRGPACLCGVVGLKPTYGRVSRRGVYPLSYTLDHCGPLTRSVADMAAVMQVIAGHDPADPGSAAVPVPDFAAALGQGVAGLRIGYARDLFAGNPLLHPDVLAAVDEAAAALQRLGAIVEPVPLPDYALFEACGRCLLAVESYAIHEADLKSRPLAYGRQTYQRLAAGAALSGADFVQALRLRRELTAAVHDRVLGAHDAIITAAGLSPAPRFDQFGPDAYRWRGMVNFPFNVTGSPALAMPVGLSASQLPLGLQIVALPFEEPLLLRIGAALESVTGPFHAPG
jgi:aspartyl-tRNA(Asn)/glutamyl-tRNA(Gln) amidotransferase subunit A